MTEASKIHERDVLIVGGGPCGLAAAIELKRANLSYVVLERGSVVESIRRFPLGMTFFSTGDLLEIGGHTFPVGAFRPTREQALAYYRRVAQNEELELRLNTEVIGGRRLPDGRFELCVARFVRSGSTGSPVSAEEVWRGRAVVFATGSYRWPNRLGVPGEDLPHVSHYYTEGHPFFGQDVVVVGGRNSAAEAALDLSRHGARVALVHRGAELSDRIKPWVLPDLLAQIKKGKIQLYLNRQMAAIEPGQVRLRPAAGEVAAAAAERGEMLPADAVFLLVGYRPHTELLQSLGVRVDPATGIPEHSAETMQTNVPGVFVAGVLAAGNDPSVIFVENGRDHGALIAAALRRG